MSHCVCIPLLQIPVELSDKVLSELDNHLEVLENEQKKHVSQINSTRDEIFTNEIQRESQGKYTCYCNYHVQVRTTLSKMCLSSCLEYHLFDLLKVNHATRIPA